MDRNKGISIIIPTYNELDTIKVLVNKIIASLKEESYEIIIVDASDSKYELSDHLPISETKDLNLIKSKYTSRSSQMNEGELNSQFDILYFLHADAIPPSEFHSKILNSIARGIDFGYFSYKFESSNIFLKINSYFSKFKSFYTGGGDQSLFIKKSVFRSMNGFDNTLELCEDFDLHRRLKKAKYKYEIINAPVKISARKYQKSNYFWVNIINFYILMRFKLGHNTTRLKSQYSRLIK